MSYLQTNMMNWLEILAISLKGDYTIMDNLTVTRATDKQIKRDRINAFKNELKSYRQLKRDHDRYFNQLKVVNNKIFGISGPSYDGMPSNSYNPFAPNPLTELFEKKYTLEGQLKVIDDRLRHINNVLSLMDSVDRDAVEKVYIKNYRIDSVAYINKITERMQKYYIDKAIYDALERLNIHVI